MKIYNDIRTFTVLYNHDNYCKYFVDRAKLYENDHKFVFLSNSSLQKQVSVMSMNLSAKLDDLQRGDRHLETTVALCEIRTQLQELTKSVESCQSEVSEVSINTPLLRTHNTPYLIAKSSHNQNQGYFNLIESVFAFL